MFTQSKTEIVYKEEPWVNVLLIAGMAPIIGFCTFGIEICVIPGGFEMRSPGSLYLLSAFPILFTIVLTYIFYRGSYLDQMAISVEGMTYQHRNSVQRYRWSQLEELEFVPCGRGSGYYRLDTVDGDDFIKINLPPYNISSIEFKDVVKFARRGQILDVAELRVQNNDKSRRMHLRLAIGAMLAVLAAQFIFLLISPRHKSRSSMAHAAAQAATVDESGGNGL